MTRGARVAEPREHPLRDIAARDCRGWTSPEEGARLRSPEWLPHWRTALVESQRDVEAQLAARKHDYDRRRAEVRTLTYFDPDWSPYQREYFSWRKRTVRFLSLVKTRQQEAKQLQGDNREKEMRRLLRACRKYLEGEETTSREDLLARFRKPEELLPRQYQA